jgi:hypothetical protein
MLGVTSHLTTNIASVPLLWVVPLSVYLLTFIIAFAKRARFSSVKVGRWAALLVAPMCLILVLEANEPFFAIAGFHLVVFALIALMAHRELAETAPPAENLTEFYLLISVGGMLGGLFNALIAPNLFTTVLEYPLALVLAMALRWKPGDPRFELRDALAVAAVALIAVSLTYAARYFGVPPGMPRTAVTMGIPALAAFFCLERPHRYALAVGGYLAVAFLIGIGSGGGVKYAKRSFFGVHRIMEREGFHVLVHGTTIHGRQRLNGPTKPVPTTYYHPTGPIGMLMKLRQDQGAAKTVGFVGLGVGSLAAYGRPGDSYTIFEIDPEVIRIAQDPKWFTFLSTSEASLRIVEGDARLSLLDEPDGQFDVLAIDAFSSDAIPIHLITLEAIQLYLEKVRDDGLVVIHISNRYLNLTPLLVGACGALKVEGGTWQNLGISDAERAEGKTASEWFVMGKSEAAVAELRNTRRLAHRADVELASVDAALDGSAVEPA